MEKKKPRRCCIGCGASQDKESLVRIIRTPEGEVKIDASGRSNGRGAYLCNNMECLQKAIKRKALSRSLKTEIDPSLYDALLKQFSEAGNEQG